jgi:hypothetical protein
MVAELTDRAASDKIGPTGNEAIARSSGAKDSRVQAAAVWSVVELLQTAIAASVVCEAARI